MKLVIASVGFDEKLPLRGIMKFGLSEGDIVLLVYSKTGGEFETRKVEKAVESLKDIVSKAGVKTEDLVISGSDFYSDVVAILNAIKKHGSREIVAVLAGGMRIIVFEVLSALLLYYRLAGVKSKVYIAREDGLYDVVLPVDMFFASLSTRETATIKLLSRLGSVERSKAVDVISKETGVSESMAYKVIKSLSRKRLIALEDDTVKLTELGRLVSGILGE